MNGLNASVNFKCTAAPWARAKSQGLSQPAERQKYFLNFQLEFLGGKNQKLESMFFTNTVGILRADQIWGIRSSPVSLFQTNSGPKFSSGEMRAFPVGR